MCWEGFKVGSFENPKFFMCKVIHLGVSLGASEQERFEPGLKVAGIKLGGSSSPVGCGFFGRRVLWIDCVASA